VNMVGGRSRSWWLVAEVLAMFVVVDQMGRRGGISARNFDCACHGNTRQSIYTLKAHGPLPPFTTTRNK